MSRVPSKTPFVSIRVDLRRTGEAEPQSWGTTVYAEDCRTPEEIKANLDAAFKAVRDKVRELCE